MPESEEHRIEQLSRMVGGRFKLATLLQKQAREYYAGGRAFMPSVRNLDELFNYILEEVQDGKITLVLRETEEEEEDKEEEAEDSED
jgi:DNA-directed RNA polymerase subunit K/omega